MTKPRQNHRIAIYLMIAAIGILFGLVTAKSYFTPEHAMFQAAHYSPAQEKKQTTLANPASENCVAKGGTLVIQTRGDDGQYGLCQFEDNQACEEWALYRGDCPVGGVKTTGFETIEQSYCAWVGGQTIAQPDASCTLPNQHVCLDIDLYNGKCE